MFFEEGSHHISQTSLELTDLPLASAFKPEVFRGKVTLVCLMPVQTDFPLTSSSQELGVERKTRTQFSRHQSLSTRWMCTHKYIRMEPVVYDGGPS